MKLRAELPIGYQAQTYANPHWIVRYPHLVRMRTTVEAILAQRPAVLLDYGAGDGHMMFNAIEAGHAGRIVTYEPVERFARQIVDECERRGLADRIEVVVERSRLRGPFNFIVCLGVLEHMPLPEREAFYDLCRRELSPDGRVLIDVPVEVGPTLLIKALARQVLKRRAAEYCARDLLRYTLGARMHDPARQDPADEATWIHHHKGFDYRMLQDEVERQGFRITERRSTPLPWLPAPFFNQERFLTIVR